MNIVKTGDGRFIEVQGTAEAMPFGRDALDDAARSGRPRHQAAHREAARHRRPPGRSRPVLMRLRREPITAATPLGEMLALASDQGLCALEFTSRRATRRGSRRGSAAGFRRTRSSTAETPIIDRATRAGSTAYFDGTAPTSASLPLDLRGAPFELRVWEALLAIPAGPDDQLRRDRRNARIAPAPRARSAPPTAPTRSRSSSPATA